MKPKIFVGSSKEGLPIAYAIQEGLENDAEITVWPQGIFDPSGYTLEALITSLYDFDFGIFVFSPDDHLTLRDSEFSTVRDNVIFELGLFIGRLGKERCFFVQPRIDSDFHIATDLLGLIPLTFDADRSDGNLVAALGPACNKIRRILNKYGHATQALPADSPRVKVTTTISPEEKMAIEAAVKKVMLTEQRRRSIIFFDLDNFTAINRWFGSEVGDEVISIIKSLLEGLATVLYSSRLGGDQFIVCVQAGEQGALAIARELLEIIRGYEWSMIASNLHVTCTMGVTQHRVGETEQDWIVRAIHGAIAAKRAGGNRISTGPWVLSRQASRNIEDYSS